MKKLFLLSALMASSALGQVTYLPDGFYAIANPSKLWFGCLGPCGYRIGQTSYNFSQTPATATTLTGSGASSTVFYYFNSSGVLTMGYDGTAISGATLSGITGASGITAVPGGATALVSCAVSLNAFVTCANITGKPASGQTFGN